MTTLCNATTKAGTRCPNRPLSGLDKCFAHAPEMADRRQKGQREGGFNKATEKRVLKRVPSDIRSTLDVLFATLQGLSDGSVEATQANAIANVSRAICSAWETGMIEAKLKELEARVEGKGQDAMTGSRVA